MAEDIDIHQLSESFSNFDKLSLKEKFSVSYNWSPQQWDEFQPENRKLKRLFTSAKHWRVKLAEAFDDLNVIVTLFSGPSSAFLSPLEISDLVEKINHDIKIVSFNRFKNPRYLALDFASQEAKTLFETTITKIGNFEVFFLNWTPVDSQVDIRVHWLPKAVPYSCISKEVSKYISIKGYKVETMVNKSGRQLGSGVHVFSGRLKKGVTLAGIPHVSYLGSLEILYTIGNRPPLCLKCNRLGHKAFQCKSIFCSTCKTRTQKQHLCNGISKAPKSYADTLKPTSEEVDFDDEDQFFDQEGGITVEDFYELSTPVPPVHSLLPLHPQIANSQLRVDPLPPLVSSFQGEFSDVKSQQLQSLSLNRVDLQASLESSPSFVSLSGETGSTKDLEQMEVSCPDAVDPQVDNSEFIVVKRPRKRNKNKQILKAPFISSLQNMQTFPKTQIKVKNVRAAVVSGHLSKVKTRAITKQELLTQVFAYKEPPDVPTDLNVSL